MQLVGGYSARTHQREKADLMIREGRNLSASRAEEAPVSCVCLSTLSPGRVLPEPKVGDGAAELHLSGRQISGLLKAGSPGS